MEPPLELTSQPLFASVVVDIATRALTTPFSYVVPPELTKELCVGSTVLVRLGTRPAVGYVMALGHEAPKDIAPAKLKPIERVLAPAAFNKTAAELALWMAKEYACPPAACVRLFLPPGNLPRLKKDAEGAWILAHPKATKRDDRWIELTSQGESFVPRPQATRQKELLALLKRGAVRMAEARALLPGVGVPIRSLEAKGVVRVLDGPPAALDQERSFGAPKTHTPQALTTGQKRALATIAQAAARRDGSVVLVRGVTGSGKTEVYLEAIEAALALGRSAIVLVPEISLTPQTVARFKGRFPGLVALLHSRLTVAERRQEWQQIAAGEARVVVGARSALFAPVKNLGLVVIDEEHEFTYKQEQAPRYHARDVAAKLVELCGAALVLGSATPSLESLARCEEGSWRGAPWTCVQMPERPLGGSLPSVSLVDLRGQHPKDGSTFSDELAHALRFTYAQGYKAMLLINRRGFAPYLMCLDCGCVPECPHCSCSLTYHAHTKRLMCHSCGRYWAIKAWPDPTASCPNCGSRYMQAMGLGTERVAAELSLLLPKAEVIRMDADTTKGSNGHQALLERFEATPAAILVGTQMIAKGLDYPDVALVGVIDADTSLKLPDFRAAERTFDLLEQVAGRAGRGAVKGRVIIQSRWVNHPAIHEVATHNPDRFIALELAQRKEGGYPPYSRLANIICSGKDENAVRQTMEALAGRVAQLAQAHGWQVVGPSVCVRSLVKDRYRHHVLIKAPLDTSFGPRLLAATQGFGGQEVSVAIDIDPYDLL